MTAPPPVSLVCKHCERAFTRPAWVTRKPGGGQFCSPTCSRAGKRRIAAEKTAKLNRTVRVPPSKGDPPAWTWPIDAGSNVVACARCQRDRQRGVRCVCERRTDDE